MKSSKLAGSCGLAPCTATLRLKPKSRPLLDCLHNWRRTTVAADSRPTATMYFPLTLKPKLAVTLAEMIGTTRSRVNFFMNKFRKLGFIHYNGGLTVHSSLLNVVIHEQPE